MTYQNATLHNIGELRAVPGSAAVRLQRVPETVRDRLEEPAQRKTLNPGGAEIRFVLNSGTAKITLSSDEETGTATLFHGTFSRNIPIFSFGQKPVTMEIGMPEGNSMELSLELSEKNQSLAKRGRFGPPLAR